MGTFVYDGSSEALSKLPLLLQEGTRVVCPVCHADLIVALDVDAANRHKVHPGIYCAVDRAHVCEFIELSSVRRDLWKSFEQRRT